MTKHPIIIQGGMGVGLSNWRLARTVSRAGQMGVVSGTALDIVLVRRLQDGDPGGHVRASLARFPVPEVAERTLERFFLPNGREGKPYASPGMFTIHPTRQLQETVIVSNFVEVDMAKHGHQGKVGINYLEKICMPLMYSLYGAMLAGVDYIIMGAGIPRYVPGLIDALTRHEDISQSLPVEGAGRDEVFQMHFSPKEILPSLTGDLPRPFFLPIISSHILGATLAKKANGRVDGFVVEGPTAGGHNAPPRGPMKLNEIGEPIYGERDEANLPELVKLGLPFWLAGGKGNPEGLDAALKAGATGIQAGTAFAFSRNSGMRADYRERILKLVAEGKVKVFTDPKASPTGFPFKLIPTDFSIADTRAYAERERVCDLGFLRSFYRREDGSMGMRCASEPVDTFVKKGGEVDETPGRMCLCNNLAATVGIGQLRKGGYEELPVFTSGDDLVQLTRLLERKSNYSAIDVIRYLLGS